MIGSFPVQPIDRPLSREFFLLLIRTALAMREYRFARQTALVWLAAFPGDLHIGLLHARALIEADHPEAAIPILDGLYQTDPEFLEAAQALLHCSILQSSRFPQRMARSPRYRPKDLSLSRGDLLGCILVLEGKGDTNTHILEAEKTQAVWIRQLSQAISCLHQGELEQAELTLHPALASGLPVPMMAITHLKILREQSQLGQTPIQAVRSLAELYHHRWPACLQFKLVLADSLMESGEPERAVSLLHEVAACDVSGQVITRLMGENHPYRRLWPARLETGLDIPVPASVAGHLGWNQLPEWVFEPREDSHLLGIDSSVTPHEYPDHLSLKPSPTQDDDLEKGEFNAAPAEDLPVDALANVEVGNDKTNLSDVSAPNVEPTNPVSPSLDETRPMRAYSSSPEALISIKEELERIGQRISRPELVRSDGRYPVYVLLTTQKGLSTQYGDQGAAKIEGEMKRLSNAIERSRRWKALLFFADDPVITNRFGVQPARPADPWSIKLALIDLDRALRRRGEMIGAVLIVGGPEVVPFHHLPNPVEDNDAFVASDNPYTTRDENYFVPEWPVGRLPGGANENPELLLLALASLGAHHQAIGIDSRQPWHRRLYTRVSAWLAHRSGGSVVNSKNGRLKLSFGYTAAVWQQAACSVFRPIGEPKSMLVSPPVQAPTDNDPQTLKRQTWFRFNLLGHKNGNTLHLPAVKMGYFNLHGLEDAVEWYGQSSFSDLNQGISVNQEDGNGESAPDETISYPIALRPSDIMPGGKGSRNMAPRVVFSEACYGAHIIGKDVDQAIALKFLQSGSQAVVGSTCTSYGSITTPLVAADYLGEAFWKGVKNGLPVGEALCRAKVSLASEMHKRQGYLDGEDQKTLISFVLYGDPLAQPLGNLRRPKSFLRPLKSSFKIRAVSDQSDLVDEPQSITPQLLMQVKKIVEDYLPGMSGAYVSIRPRQDGKYQARTRKPRPAGITQRWRGKAKTKPGENPAKNVAQSQVVILHKQVPENGNQGRLHDHYARLTLNERGKLVKLVVSR